ncbi:MAG: hypothetical protein LBN22_02195 [Clostridiales Family XIII bacterium]|nr:hypothetical protein [Clostridiales Family XIII bacterium]
MKSIAMPLSYLIVVMIVITAMAVGVFSYYAYRKDSIDRNSERVMSLAQAVAAIVNADSMAKVMSDQKKMVSGRM